MSEEEKQESTIKDKKKSLSLPVIIAIIAGGIIILVVALILIISLMMNNMKESILNSTGKDTSQVVKKKEKKVETLDKFEYLETGRITTNPQSSSQFVVVNLGIFYGPEKSKKSDDEKVELTPDELKSKNQRLNALIRHQINSQIGSMDVYALQIPRDSLMITFKEKLKPAFKMEGYFLKDVILLEFIIQ
jgi:flagellar basal body-associated protein FliL